MARSTQADADPIRAVLRTARDEGFVGPGPVARQLIHARAFAAALEEAGRILEVPAGAGGRAWRPGGQRACLDLGSGGGLPGLVLAWDGRCNGPGSSLAGARWHLLESQHRRAVFLRDACLRLGLDPEVTVEEGRAEEAAHDSRYRRQFQVVTARSFGSPAVTAECAAGFLADGGVLVVSEPPSVGAGDHADRWPHEALEELGFGASAPIVGPFHFRALVMTGRCPARMPRRAGVPAKRPLW